MLTTLLFEMKRLWKFRIFPRISNFHQSHLRRQRSISTQQENDKMTKNNFPYQNESLLWKFRIAITIPNVHQYFTVKWCHSTISCNHNFEINVLLLSYNSWTRLKNRSNPSVSITGFPVYYRFTMLPRFFVVLVSFSMYLIGHQHPKSVTHISNLSLTHLVSNNRHQHRIFETSRVVVDYVRPPFGELDEFIGVIWVRWSLSRVMIYEIFMTSPEWGLAHLLCAKRYTSFSSYKLNIKLINLLIYFL